jgi:L-aminopeptidase/D-esterase-like protein
MMTCSTRLVGCSGFVIDVGLVKVGVARSTRSLSGATGRHSSVVLPDSSTTLMHSAAAGMDGAREESLPHPASSAITIGAQINIVIRRRPGAALIVVT